MVGAFRPFSAVNDDVYPAVGRLQRSTTTDSSMPSPYVLDHKQFSDLGIDVLMSGISSTQTPYDEATAAVLRQQQQQQQNQQHPQQQQQQQSITCEEIAQIQQQIPCDAVEEAQSQAAALLLKDTDMHGWQPEPHHQQQHPDVMYDDELAQQYSPSPDIVESTDGPAALKGSSDSASGMKNDLAKYAEDDEIQSKRKAQNRAAQRAFRERREKHVRELQDRIAKSEARVKKLESDNARLVKEVNWYMAENKILRDTTIEMRDQQDKLSASMSAATAAAAAAAASSNNGSGRAGAGTSSAEDARSQSTQVTFPKFLNSESELQHSQLIASTIPAGKLLTPAEIWDRIATHPRADCINAERVVKLLMAKVQCSGHGPVFFSSDVDDAIAKLLLDAQTRGSRSASISSSISAGTDGNTPKNSSSSR
ncbi:uncharacterized protein V1518DRAFT_409804 [Limtongia smithiae]|uniref:uncharacterized protein n=1 Tax=Limtongia smithiae TaxID=1125753 RepID=UPI0034CDD2D0